MPATMPVALNDDLLGKLCELAADWQRTPEQALAYMAEACIEIEHEDLTWRKRLDAAARGAIPFDLEAWHAADPDDLFPRRRQFQRYLLPPSEGSP